MINGCCLHKTNLSIPVNGFAIIHSVGPDIQANNTVHHICIILLNNYLSHQLIWYVIGNRMDHIFRSRHLSTIFRRLYCLTIDPYNTKTKLATITLINISAKFVEDIGTETSLYAVTLISFGNETTSAKFTSTCRYNTVKYDMFCYRSYIQRECHSVLAKLHPITFYRGMRGSWSECHFVFSLVYQLCLALW